MSVSNRELVDICRASYNDLGISNDSDDSFDTVTGGEGHSDWKIVNVIQ